jgi:hypothetical protein
MNKAESMLSAPPTTLRDRTWVARQHPVTNAGNQNITAEFRPNYSHQLLK